MSSNGQPDLVARLLIDNRQALEALHQVETEGVRVAEHTGAAIEQIPLAFHAMEMAGDAALAVLSEISRELQEGFNAALESLRASGTENETVKLIDQLKKAYEEYILTIGSAIVNNEDFQEALGKMVELINKMMAEGTVAQMVDDLARIANTLADGIIWLEKYHDELVNITQTISSGGLNQALEAARGAIDFFRGSTEESTKATEDSIVALKSKNDILAANKQATLDAKAALTALNEMMAEEKRIADELGQGAANYEAQQKAKADENAKRHAESEKAWAEMKKGFEERQAAIKKMQLDIGELYMHAQEWEKSYFEQNFKDIDQWVVKTVRSYSEVELAKMHMQRLDEEHLRQLELGRIYEEETSKARRWQMKQQIADIEEYAKAYTESMKTTEDRLYEFLDGIYKTNHVAGKAFDNTAAAIKNVGDQGVDALQRMAREAGVFIGTIDSATGTGMSATTSFEKSGLDVGSNVRFLKGLGLSNQQVRESILGSGSDNIASAIGREVAAALAAYADRDGTLQLSQAGYRG